MNSSLLLPTPTGAQLRAAREAAGHTQVLAAELVGVARRTWEDWEAGRRQPQAMVLRLYRLLTDQDPDYELRRRAALEA